MGTGNVAWHLAHGLNDTDVSIWGRNTDKAKSIAQSANIRMTSTVEDCDNLTVFFAVNDDSIQDLSTRFSFVDATAVHLSGSLSINALKAKKKMVMWPVSSLVTGESQDLTAFPWVIQGNYSDHLPSFSFFSVNDDLSRRRFHLAATVLNNFIHQMGVMVQDVIEDAPDGLYNTLLHQTVQRMMRNDAETLQTGPAKRNDRESIANHLELLHNHNDLKDVYSLFTTIIKTRYGHEL